MQLKFSSVSPEKLINVNSQAEAHVLRQDTRREGRNLDEEGRVEYVQIRRRGYQFGGLEMIDSDPFDSRRY
jgi:hypothetical protein